MNKPKRIGTAAETAVTRYARTAGFPLAERRALAGGADLGDILLAPGVIVGVILEMTLFRGRMRAAPEGGGTPLRGLTHSLDSTKEGL